MNQQEKDLEIKMKQNAKQLKEAENEMLVLFLSFFFFDKK